jgi:hypothetical protein
VRWDNFSYTLPSHLRRFNAISPIIGKDGCFIAVFDNNCLFEIYTDGLGNWKKTPLFGLESETFIHSPLFDSNHGVIGFLDKSDQLYLYYIDEKKMEPVARIIFNFYEFLNEEEIIFISNKYELVRYSVFEDKGTMIASNVASFSLSNNKRFLFYRSEDSLNSGLLIDLHTDIVQNIVLDDMYFISTSKPTNDGSFIVALLDKRKDNRIFDADICIINAQNNKISRTNYMANYADAIFIK